MWKNLYILFCIKNGFIFLASAVRHLMKFNFQNFCSSNIEGAFSGSWAESFGRICLLLAFHRVKIPRTRKTTAMTEK